jgi:hypothetical protein
MTNSETNLFAPQLSYSIITVIKFGSVETKAVLSAFNSLVFCICKPRCSLTWQKTATTVLEF